MTQEKATCSRYGQPEHGMMLIVNVTSLKQGANVRSLRCDLPRKYLAYT